MFNKPVKIETNLSDLRLGQILQCKVTGLRGTATNKIELLSGSVQFSIQPEGDGKTVVDGWNIDWQSLDVIGDGISKTLPTPAKSPFKLGQDVRDTITGFEGVIIQTCTYTNGCVSHAVQPKNSKKVKEGELPDMVYFDWKRLEAKSVAPKQPSETVTGGPSTRTAAMRHA